MFQVAPLIEKQNLFEGNAEQRKTRPAQVSISNATPDRIVLCVPEVASSSQDIFLVAY